MSRARIAASLEWFTSLEGDLIMTTPRSRRLRRAALAAGAALGTAYAGSFLAPLAQAASNPAPFTVTFFHHVLTIDGDATRNAMVVGRTPAGLVTLNGTELFERGTKISVVDVELVQLDGGAGDDILRLDQTNGPMPSGEFFGGEGNDILDGGNGDDRLAGGPGVDTLNGRAGTDEILGGAGNDKATGGSGDDLVELGDDSDQFTWNPGDGSDVVNGEAGKDTVIFNGSNASEQVVLSAAGSDLLLRRNVGNISMFLAGFELVVTNLGGGSDSTTINSLAGSGVGVLQLNHAAGDADTGFDTVIVNGTREVDRVRLFGDSRSPVVTVGGLGPALQLTGADGLTVQGLAGDDVIDGGRLSGGLVSLTERGGNDDDTLVGTPGDDRLFGEQGDDRLEGRGGNDLLDGGPGTNVVVP
jgi:Ca2+-binding RTX toxin-like protein